MPRFELLSVGDIHVLRCESSRAPRGRYFLRYRVRRGFRWLLGHPVTDEYATVSSPLFFGPRAQLGRIYDLGISLGHRRDPEMGIDLGWPPLCIGLDRPATVLAGDWQDSWLDRLGSDPGGSPGAAVPGVHHAGTVTGPWHVDAWTFDEHIRVLATDAPLVPEQLQRLCDTDDHDLTVAVSTGNRLQHGAAGEPGIVQALSEHDFNLVTMAIAAQAAVGPAGA